MICFGSRVHIFLFFSSGKKLVFIKKARRLRQNVALRMRNVKKSGPSSWQNPPAQWNAGVRLEELNTP